MSLVLPLIWLQSHRLENRCEKNVLLSINMTVPREQLHIGQDIPGQQDRANTKTWDAIVGPRSRWLWDVRHWSDPVMHRFGMFFVNVCFCTSCISTKLPIFMLWCMVLGCASCSKRMVWLGRWWPNLSHTPSSTFFCISELFSPFSSQNSINTRPKGELPQLPPQTYHQKWMFWLIVNCSDYVDFHFWW